MKHLMEEDKWSDKFNPDYALDFVMKTQDTIKLSAHGLFLKVEYFCIVILKIGVSA